jgi:hypothetical protein
MERDTGLYVRMLACESECLYVSQSTCIYVGMLVSQNACVSECLCLRMLVSQNACVSECLYVCRNASLLVYGNTYVIVIEDGHLFVCKNA